MTFGSPTAFKSTQGYYVPLPQPELVFGSLLDRWNAFSSVPLSPALTAVFYESMATESVDIHSQEVKFGGGQWASITGFMGRVTYRMQKTSSDIRRAVNALAAFACYSGVGVKTTVGLGQVRRH